MACDIHSAHVTVCCSDKCAASPDKQRIYFRSVLATQIRLNWFDLWRVPVPNVYEDDLAQNDKCKISFHSAVLRIIHGPEITFCFRLIKITLYVCTSHWIFKWIIYNDWNRNTTQWPSVDNETMFWLVLFFEWAKWKYWKRHPSCAPGHLVSFKIYQL